MPISAIDDRAPVGSDFANTLAEIFRHAGWRIRRHPVAGELHADLVVENDRRNRYVVEIKSTAEGRGDRLVPLLSQAILQARTFADSFPESAAALAVVAARHVPSSVANQIKRFAERYAPDMAIGVMDAEGARWFIGPGLEGLDSKPISPARLRGFSPTYVPDLFSDLNQWMLKILVGQRLPAALISIPREQIRNASHLAKAAKASTMSASRLVNQLAGEGFLDKHSERLQLVRTDELLERWVAASPKMSRDLPARFIVKKDERQFFATVARYAAESRHGEDARGAYRPRSGAILRPRPRCCIGLFAAADALGLGFVRGVSPYLYCERLDFDVLRQLGLSVEDADRRADVIIRIPSNKKAIFRALVTRGNLPVSDVLQVWLAVSSHPTRGRRQADEIWRRVLKPGLAIEHE